jgi:acyl-CoA thioester hydrolase
VTSKFFEKHFEVGWRDVDPNGHVANMTYLEYAVDTRVAFFDACGFPPQNFRNQRFGPVIKNDFVEYFREVMMLEKLTVTMENGGFSEDGSRFRVINSIYKQDRTPVARVTSIGGWLDLLKRKLTIPHNTIIEAWQTLPRTEDFEVLNSSIKR